jgi:hypothetical protein
MGKKTREIRSTYQVGYGRPPAASRFQPGQSGNPKGRPKGARNISSIARDALERAISIKEKGKWRKTTVRKAAFQRLAEKAIAGDVKALQCLLSLESAERLPRAEDGEMQPLSARDLELLQRFFDRRRTSQEGEAQNRQLKQHSPEKENK